MALEAERSASAGSVEGIGLGMLEPRPTTPACGTPGSVRSASPITPLFDRRGSGGRLRGETPPPSATIAPPVVLDGIFEVLENR